MFKLTRREEGGASLTGLGFDSRSGCRRAPRCPLNRYTTCPGKPRGRRQGPGDSQMPPQIVPPLVPWLMMADYHHKRSEIMFIQCGSPGGAETGAGPSGAAHTLNSQETKGFPTEASLQWELISRRPMVWRLVSPLFLLPRRLRPCRAQLPADGLPRRLDHVELLSVPITDVHDLLVRGFYYLHGRVALHPIIRLSCHRSRGSVCHHALMAVS